MQKNEVLQLIDEKLAQLQEAEKRNKWNQHLSFGVHLQAYRQSPFMEAFLKKRKNVRRQILIAALVAPLIMTLWGFDFYGKLEQNPWIAVAALLVHSVIVGLVVIYSLTYSVASAANNAQHEVKKMMLTDLRQKIEQMES